MLLYRTDLIWEILPYEILPKWQLELHVQPPHHSHAYRHLYAKVAIWITTLDKLLTLALQKLLLVLETSYMTTNKQAALTITVFEQGKEVK